jgi:hypothetical protein
MGPLDTILTVVFGLISVGALAGSVYCVRTALKVSGQKNGDFKMFAWAFLSFIGLIISGMSAAYILVPIFLGR